MQNCLTKMTTCRSTLSTIATKTDFLLQNKRTIPRGRLEAGQRRAANSHHPFCYFWSVWTFRLHFSTVTGLKQQEETKSVAPVVKSIKRKWKNTFAARFHASWLEHHGCRAVEAIRLSWLSKTHTSVQYLFVQT